MTNLNCPPTIDTATGVLTPVSKMVRDRLGKKLPPSTLFRWLRQGVRGAILPAVNIGGKWHTTKAAWAWWIEQQTLAAMAPRLPRNALIGADDETLQSAGLL